MRTILMVTLVGQWVRERMTYRDDTYFKKYAEHAKGATEELKEASLKKGKNLGAFL